MDKIAKRKNFFYPLGLFSYNLSTYTFSNRIQFFYIDVLGLGAGLVSVGWFIFGIWNAINDPLMGQVSDRTRSRWGRRIPYIRFGAIPLAIAFYLMWTPPETSPLLTIAYFLVAVFVYDTLSTLLFMSLNALFAEITVTPKERANLAAARESLGGIGLIAAFILAPILSNRLGYAAMGAVVAVLVLAGFVTSMIGIKEDPARQGDEPVSFGRSIRTTLQNKPFRWFLGAAMMREFNFITLSAAVPFWRTYVLDLSTETNILGMQLGKDTQEAMLLAVTFVLAIPCLQIWRALTPKYGARRTWMIASLAWIPGLIMIYLANDFYSAVLGTAMIAPGLAGYMMLYVVTLSEITDFDAKQTGQFREGIYFGISGLFMRLAFSLQALVFALLLTPSGYIPNAAFQPVSAVNAIRFIMAGTPALACLLSFSFLFFMHIPKAAPQVQPAAAGDLST